MKAILALILLTAPVVFGQSATTMDAELDKNQHKINVAVDQVVDGGDVRTELEKLIAEFPLEYRDAVIQRFRDRITELNKEYERRRKEQERARKQGVVIDGELFNLAGAVLMMNTGSYETITPIASRGDTSSTAILQAGATLLDHGVKPDTKMLRRLWDIYNRAIAKQRAANTPK